MLGIWDDLRHDLRYAIRTLIKSPGFAAIVIGSLALGIGANTAIFTIAKQVLFDRLSVPHPEQLQLITWTAPKPSIVQHLSDDPGPTGQRTSIPYPVYQQLRDANQVLGELFAFAKVGRLSASIDGEAVAVQAQMVSGNYYKALEVYPALGRPIEPADDAVPGSGAVATISDALWTRAFGRSPSVIGKSISLNGKPITIIGVNPTNFTGASDALLSPEIMVPLSMQPVLLPQRQGSLLNDPEQWWVQVMGRLKTGVPAATAQASLDMQFQSILAVGNSEQRAIPRLLLADGSRGLNASARSFAEPTYVLLAVVGLVLLLACANIASLLLARSEARNREISVRIALGAKPTRIFRQMLTESLLLSSLGGAAGLALGYAGRNLLPFLISPAGQRSVFNGNFDGRVFAFTAGVSILAGLLFGLAPAWKAIQTNPELKAQTKTATSRRRGLGSKLIVSFQVALSTLLIVGAMLFLRTLSNLGSVNPGFRTDHLLLFRIPLPPSVYPPPQDVNLLRNIEQKLAATPGVEAVTLSAQPLISNAYETHDFVPLNQSPGDGSNPGEAWTNAVGQSFFPTMGIPILSGRGFNQTDTENSPKVAVINQTLARQFFPDGNPLGKTFTGYSSVKQAPFQIVGICADTHYDSLRKQPPPTYYVLYNQLPRTEGDMTYEVRTSVTPGSLVPMFRQAVQSVDKNIPLINIRTQDEQIYNTIRQEWLLASLATSFSVLALLLACIGIYGIMTHTVVRRTNEIGIRFALGAQTRGILWMILNESFRVTLLGIVVGLVAAFIFTRFLSTMLFGLKPGDPVTMVGSTLLLVVVSLLAALIPALRAARMKPMQALRQE